MILPVKNGSKESDGELLTAIGTGDRRALEELEEIAAITDAPVGTVKARMYHARAKLRQHLPALGGGGIEACRSSEL